MNIIIAYSPEMNVFSVYIPGRPTKTYTESEVPEKLTEVFNKAKDAVMSGRATMGICVNVD
jgi:hypothetical protein